MATEQEVYDQTKFMFGWALENPGPAKIHETAKALYQILYNVDSETLSRAFRDAMEDPLKKTKYPDAFQILRHAKKYDTKGIEETETETYKFGKDERQQIHDMAMRFPKFIPLLQEIIDDNDVYTTKEWNGRFWGMMSDRRNFSEGLT